MIRLCAALLLLLATPPQADDARKRVKELVEQLQADEIQAVEDAVVALVALGPSALDPIREEARASRGDTKLRLEEAARKIERNVKRGRAFGPPVLVTLDARDRALPEILADIKKSTGQPLSFEGLPADKVTASLEKAPFWEALDRICRAHGGVMWEVKEKEVVVSKRPYRDLPKVYRGNLVLYFERLTSEHRLQPGRTLPSVTLEGGIAWAKGSEPPHETLVVDEFRDDRGTDLRARAAGAAFTFSDDECVEPDVIGKNLYFSEQNVLDEKASKLARLKGSVKLEYVLESRKIATLEKPAALVGKPRKVDEFTFTLHRFTAFEGDVSARVFLQAPRGFEKVRVRTSCFRLVDTRGVAHPATGWTDEDVDETTGRVTYNADLDFTLDPKVGIAALEFSIPTDVEQVEIPFDFKDLPLR